PQPARYRDTEPGRGGGFRGRSQGGLGMSGLGPRPTDDGAGRGMGLVMRPHPLFILLRPLKHVAWVALLCLIAVLGVKTWLWAGLGTGPSVWMMLFAGGLLVLARLLWAVAEWATRTYGLTNGVVWAEHGVLNRRRDELPLTRVQSMALDRPLLPRVLGLGSIGFATAGTSGYEVVWLLIGKPSERLREVRGAMGGLEAAA
ncbi:MAG: PH domain-containing protein, partial [Phycisphaerales bacterium]|nr:PH domain-containing protein [Phycisphaerales bacterium]